MSKIVDALRKIQSDRSGSRSVPLHAHRKIGRMESNNVAKDVEAGDDTIVLSTERDEVSRVVKIDKEAMREAGLIAPESENKLFEDEYRVIKRPIIANAFGPAADQQERGFVVLVTSALAGDGKTFTCINLALSLAREQDSSVVLIDADVPKPHISTLFDAQDEVGLLDYLDGSAETLEEIQIGTSVDGLTIIPTGQVRDNATELLSGNRMLELLDSIHRSDPKRIILIDSSPLVQTTEARALAARSGQVVVVVRAGITPKGAVAEAIEALDQSKPVNLVLNQVRSKQGSGYYGPYYGSGYRSAVGDNDVVN